MSQSQVYIFSLIVCKTSRTFLSSLCWYNETSLIFHNKDSDRGNMKGAVVQTFMFGWNVCVWIVERWDGCQNKIIRSASLQSADLTVLGSLGFRFLLSDTLTCGQHPGDQSWLLFSFKLYTFNIYFVTFRMIKLSVSLLS